jgi:murein L,D-transpeptidase YcbB/YkuD
VKNLAGIVLLGALTAVGGCGAGASEARRALQEAASVTRRPAFVTADREGTRLWKLTRAFYERREHRLAWIDGTHPGNQMDDLIRALEAATLEGLDPGMYSLGDLKVRRAEAGRGFLTKKGFEPEQAAQMDIWLTYLYMKYASDLADGISDLAHADRSWKIEPEAFDPLDHLERALTANRVTESLVELTPQTPQYRQLRESLANYRRIADAGGWPKLPARLRLRRGQASDAAAHVARRLAISGDYTGAVPERGAVRYDESLSEAIKRFQRRHGLEQDGSVGAATIAAMNVPVERRIAQIRLNLERWRWLPRELGARHIVVNIPAYRLDVWEADRRVLSMRVVVGRRETPTPIFNDRMTYLVFSPYWNVPPDIAENETLPAILQDAGFLERNNMEVIDADGNPVDPASIDLQDPGRYRFRQRPGRENSLGLVKFMFPNQFNVYLHDTPADSLFARATRSFSHGCVRVERPEALAQYLLRDQGGWPPERIATAMHSLEEQTVRLAEPVPVYLGYWTASATPEGVHFTGDLYGIDRRQAALVAERAARLKKSARAGGVLHTPG